MLLRVHPPDQATRARVRSRRQVRADVRLALLAALVTLTLAVTPAQAAKPLFRLSGSVEQIQDPSTISGALTVPAAQQLAQVQAAAYYVVTGTFVGADLLFSFTLEATGGVPVVAVEVALDPAGSQMVLAVGQPTIASLGKLQQLQDQGSATSSVNGGSIGVGTLAVWRSTHGFFSTFWTDPAGITVNSVIDEAHWQYDGSKVRSLTGNDSRQWLTGNQWFEVSHSIGAYYNAASTVGTVYTNDHFRTTSGFPCGPTGAHDIWYQANNVYGFADGHTGGGVNTWATGPCKGLLSVTAFASPGS